MSLNLQQKAQAVLDYQKSGDQRVQVLLMFLSSITGVSNAECWRRIVQCAQTGRM